MIGKDRIAFAIFGLTVLVASSVWLPVSHADTSNSGIRVADSNWQVITPDESLSHAFILAVRPQVQAAISGIYGAPPLFEHERVTSMRKLRSDPKVVQIEVKVDTFEGAHNPLGTVTILFRTTPLQISIGEVKQTRIERTP